MRTLLAVILCLLAAPAVAHEVRPAYLDMKEIAPGEFRVLWKTPMQGDLRLALHPAFSGWTRTLTPIVTRESAGGAIQTWRMAAIEPLQGRRLRIEGLAATMTDALVRIEFADGATWTKRLTAAVPEAEIPHRQTEWTVASEYLQLGVEHILTGVDHLLFVLALLLIAGSRSALLKAVTAFTVAHSITLGLATLGFVHVPPPPVEAAIALSIAFVAAEILRGRRGQVGLATRAPWVVAFAFGLLHGFGFAGALTEIGLPQGHIPLALLFFNLGVEVGQLLFIGGVLCLLSVVRRMRLATPRWVEPAVPYAIGSVAMFWVVERVAAF